MLPDDPIGIFDSGVGGLTIMRQVVDVLPHENIIYFADTARCPYGNKSPEIVTQYVLENASFLLSKKIKLLIIACFTAASHAFDILQKRLPIPVIGVVENSLKNVTSKRIAILATTGTIQSGVIQSLILKKEPSTVLFPVACPLFTPLIEEGLIDHPATRLIVAHTLEALKNKGIDTALLACTHYPLIRPLIQDCLGPSVQLIEPSRNCAIEARDWLASKNLLNLQKKKPTHTFYTSGESEKFRHLTNLLLGIEKNRNAC
jgi:glutamate racemase